MSVQISILKKNGKIHKLSDIFSLISLNILELFIAYIEKITLFIKKIIKLKHTFFTIVC